jgi:hypothetical protein
MGGGGSPVHTIVSFNLNIPVVGPELDHLGYGNGVCTREYVRVLARTVNYVKLSLLHNVLFLYLGRP